MGLRGDSRAQAGQVGAILLFAVIIILLSIYQAYMIPNQDQQVEFNHFTGAQSDMVNLRNTVLKAGQEKSTLPAGVTLGTRYPSRLIGVQPPGSSGSLRSETIGGSTDTIQLKGTDANISKICGIDSPTTRRVTYSPDYNFLHSVGNVTYENSVTYTMGPDGGRALLTDQQLVTGNVLHLYPLVGPYNRTGSDRTAITLHGGTTGVKPAVSGPFSLILPTRLTAAEWTSLLSGQQLIDNVSAVPGRAAVNITFVAGHNVNIQCSPAGAGTPPNNKPSIGGTGTNINPNFGSDVVLTGIQERGNNTNSLGKNQVRITINNTNENDYQNISAIRFPFYLANAQSNSQVNLPERFTYGSDNFTRLGRYTQLNTKIRIPPNQNRNMTLSFYCSATGTSGYNLYTGDYFVLNMFFDNGKERTYFIGLHNSPQGKTQRC